MGLNMHRFSRTELLIGREGLKKLERSKIAVFGIGGVGSYAVEGLARAGVGSLVLIDHDHIDITNINRQIHSITTTLGRSKVEVMAERVLDIDPRIKTITHQVFLREDNVSELINADLDYIVDAIDTVASKVRLILAATEMKIPIISSMGAGNRLDPLKFQISDIYNTSVCPLAKIMRKELKKKGIESLKVVYSTEKPVKIEGKTKTIGSISYVPSVAGLIMAGEVIKYITGL